MGIRIKDLELDSLRFKTQNLSFLEQKPTFVGRRAIKTVISRHRSKPVVVREYRGKKEALLQQERLHFFFNLKARYFV